MKALKIVGAILIAITTILVIFKVVESKLACLEYEDDELPIENC